MEFCGFCFQAKDAICLQRNIIFLMLATGLLQLIGFDLNFPAFLLEIYKMNK